MTTTSQITFRRPAPGRPASGLFDAAGAARRLRASPLLSIGPSRPGPSLRRGALVGAPVGLALVLELGFGAPTKGAIGTGALLAGFPGLDAPAGPRAAWQAAAAPLIGLAAALGVLSSQTAATAVLAMGVLGVLAGYCFAVTLRLAIFGLSVALALLIAQGLFLAPAAAGPALLYGTAGGLLQAAWSLLIWVLADRAAEDEASGWNRRATAAALAANLDLASPACRHAIRFGASLAIGVAAYRALGLHDHGFWIPLTILFVMRPERDETFHRLVLRAVGTALGLVIATALAESLHGEELAIGFVLAISAALAYGLLTVQYALFTAAITVYVVLLSDTLGEGAFEAAGQRALGTALGIAIAGLAFVFWPNPGEGGEARIRRPGAVPPPPKPAAR